MRGPVEAPHADLAVPGGAEQAESDAATFFESELPGVGAWQFDARRAAQVRQPVLFMMGSATLPFYKEAGERIREWWPESERYVVAGAGHALQIVEPDEVAKGLAEFITRH
jgi:pimeloyl-ACP methyl ester carboxylesterase